jgi:hypothetical protein
MRAIIVFILDKEDVRRDETPESRGTEALPTGTSACDAAAPFWTWFIENPRCGTPSEVLG